VRIKMTPIQRIIRKILIAETSHPFIIIFIALALSAISIFYTVRNLGFQTSRIDLISPDNRLAQLSEQADPFNDLDTFVVAIENKNISRSLEFLHALATLLEADHDNYIQIFYRVDPEILRPWALLYLNKEDLLTLRDNLGEHQDFISNLAQSPGLISFFRGINNEMASKMVGELFTGFLDEGLSHDDDKPLDLDFLIRVLGEMIKWIDGCTSFHSPWGSFFTKKSWDADAEKGYFWTDNKKYILVFVTPKKKSNNFTNALHSLTALRKAVSSVQDDFPEVNAGVTGQDALNMDEMDAALGDMSIATILSLVGLTLLLVIFWRGIRRPLLEITELLVALSLTFGLTTLFIGHLNILSVTFAPLLLGLGIDYGIHWFARYQEEEQLRHVSKEEAIQSTMIKLGPAVILAGITAALSFFPLVFTGFKGLVELGIITSMGMVMTTVTTICFLPAITLVFDKTRYKVQKNVASAQLKPLFRLGNERAFFFLITACILFGFSLWGSRNVSFDLNMLRLQSKKAESVIWEKKLLQNSERSSLYGVILAHSLEEVKKKTEALKALPSVSEVHSVETILPHNQEEKIDLLRQMKPLLPTAGLLQSSGDMVDIVKLNKILGNIRFKMLDSGENKWGTAKPLEVQMKQVRDLIEKLRSRFSSMMKSQRITALATFEKILIQDLDEKFEILRMNVNTTPIKLDDLPRPLVQRFVDKNNLYLIRVFPSHNIWEPELTGQFVHELRSVDPDAIGNPVTLYVFTKAFRDACIKAAVYAVIFIIVLLFITFRRFSYTLIAITPLVVGTVWTMGLMDLFGVDFNLANSIFLPLIVGAGIEYGIIIVQRWRQVESENGDIVLPFSTGKGIILAGLTTTIGFGSLTISDHQGVYSLGLLATIGSISILAAAIFLIPSILQLVKNFSKMGKLDSATHLSVEQSAKK